MAQYFTHYWNKESAEEAEFLAEQGDPYMDHIASNQFDLRNVEIGDYVFAVNTQAGSMRVLGFMQVGEVMDYREAGAKLDYPVRSDVQDHLIAKEGTALSIICEVPMDIVERLRFVRFDDPMRPPRALAFSKANPELLDSQTLRGVRNLTPDSAELLNNFVSKYK
jgi:hypothetical protein